MRLVSSPALLLLCAPIAVVCTVLHRPHRQDGVLQLCLLNTSHAKQSTCLQALASHTPRCLPKCCQPVPHMNQTSLRNHHVTLIMLLNILWPHNVCLLPQALDECMARGAEMENIRVVAVVVAPPAMAKLSSKYPGGTAGKGPGKDGAAVMTVVYATG